MLSSKNHTESYVAYIREKLGIQPKLTNFWDDDVPMQRYAELMLHMANFEGAKGVFNLTQVQRGIALA